MLLLVGMQYSMGGDIKFGTEAVALRLLLIFYNLAFAIGMRDVMKAYKEFSDRVETVAVDKMGKSERVKDLLDKRLGKLSKREISDIYPDISVTTIEKALSDLLKERYIIKVGSGRGTGYIKNG